MDTSIVVSGPEYRARSEHPGVQGASSRGSSQALASPLATACVRGGLTAWKTKRIRSYIEANQEAVIRVVDLAGVAQLSTSHFSRAFRKTFGMTAVAYISQQRIRRAQELMLTSVLSLSQVALECGMCDQSHFSRVFRRIVGINPQAWRHRTRPDLTVGRPHNS
jgi:AraC family transcriptional regulator